MTLNKHTKSSDMQMVEIDFSKEKGSITDKIYNYSLDNIKVILLNTQNIYRHLKIGEFLRKINTFENMGSIITTVNSGQKSVQSFIRKVLIKIKIYRLFD